MKNRNETTLMDALIIGGGPAGLSAALALGRMGLSAVVYDDGKPRNAASQHLNNFPTRDGGAPAAWRAAARADLARYSTVRLHCGSVRSLIQREDRSCFEARSDGGEAFRARRVILADGIVDRLPEVPGFRALWGRGVHHCPFCHGFEVRGKRLGVIVSGEVADHYVPMIAGLGGELALFLNGGAPPSPRLSESLKKRKIPVYSAAITALEAEEPVESSFPEKGPGMLRAVHLANGDRVPREALFLAPPMPYQLRSDLGIRLGCEQTPVGLFKVNAFNETTVPGVYAAGDNMSAVHSVLNACAQGSLAGAMVVRDLLTGAFYTG